MFDHVIIRMLYLLANVGSIPSLSQLLILYDEPQSNLGVVQLHPVYY